MVVCADCRQRESSKPGQQGVCSQWCCQARSYGGHRPVDQHLRCFVLAVDGAVFLHTGNEMFPLDGYDVLVQG